MLSVTWSPAQDVKLCNHLVAPLLWSHQVLEVVRSNYDTLTLKLQDGLDQFERYSEQPKEVAFFKELVRDAEALLSSFSFRSFRQLVLAHIQNWRKQL